MSAYHIRVCAVGSEAQMRLMLSAMMRNASLDDEDEDTVVPARMEDQLEMLRELAYSQGASQEGFLYETICRTPFGSADMETACMQMRQPCPGIWTVLFDYHSPDPFQPQDFIQLQRRSDGLLFCAQYAAKDLAREKGRMLLAAGKAMDNWDSMDACWFWLSYRYLCGESPADLVDALKKLTPDLQMEDEELTPDVLLSECEENLRLLAEAAAQPLTPSPGSLITLAESELWDLSRLPLYLSCLHEARTAWEGRC